MIKHSVGHSSSSSSGKCILCNKVTCTYLVVSKMDSEDSQQKSLGSQITIPICDEHFNDLSESCKEILIGFAKQIDKTVKKINKIKKDVK